MSYHRYVRVLQDIVSRKKPSRTLSFSVPHVLKAFQLLHEKEYVSRSCFCQSLRLGEGSVKTMILHMKEGGYVNTIRSGTTLTQKGKRLVEELLKVIPNECRINRSEIAPGRYNFAVLLRNASSKIKDGLSQRDYAVLYGAQGATTLIFEKKQFLFPAKNMDPFKSDNETFRLLVKNLEPLDGDVVIISSANDPFISEISAKNSALFTLAHGEF